MASDSEVTRFIMSGWRDGPTVFIDEDSGFSIFPDIPFKDDGTYLIESSAIPESDAVDLVIYEIRPKGNTFRGHVHYDTSGFYF